MRDGRGLLACAFPRDRDTVGRCAVRLERRLAVARRTGERLHVVTGTVAVAALSTWLRDASRHDPSHAA